LIQPLETPPHLEMSAKTDLPVELLISKRSVPIKKKTPKGKQTKKPKNKASQDVKGEGVAKAKENKDTLELQDVDQEEMSDDDPSDQDSETQQDLGGETKARGRDCDDETKEGKRCYVVTFKGQFNCDSNQFGIFRSECEKPIVCYTMERAQQIKQDTINKYLDKFYDNLVKGRDKIDFTNKVRPNYNNWARKSEYEIRYKHFPGACYTATFNTEDEAKEFAKLLTWTKRGKNVQDWPWIRKVCQSYLRLKMRITAGYAE
jgi:hypothetical protein